MSQGLCLSIPKVPAWIFTGPWFFNTAMGPKKQKLLFFELLLAWTNVKLLMKLNITGKWYISHPCKKYSNENMRHYYSFTYTKPQHLIRKSTLANGLVKPRKAHWINNFLLIFLSSGISSHSLKAEGACWHSVVANKFNIKNRELFWNIQIPTKYYYLMTCGCTYLKNLSSHHGYSAICLFPFLLILLLLSTRGQAGVRTTEFC